MDENEDVAPDLQQATDSLEEGLETCQKIVSDYRSALLSLKNSATSPDELAANPD